jgi:hypothetical protein
MGLGHALFAQAQFRHARLHWPGLGQAYLGKAGFRRAQLDRAHGRQGNVEGGDLSEQGQFGGTARRLRGVGGPQVKRGDLAVRLGRRFRRANRRQGRGAGGLGNWRRGHECLTARQIALGLLYERGATGF